MAIITEFPTELWVVERTDEESNVTWIAVEPEDVGQLKDGEDVAIYKLIESGVVEQTTTINTEPVK